MLTIGTDSYVTVGGADSYVEANYLPTDAKATAWSALVTSSKEILLRRAARQIDLLPFPGQRTYPAQSMAWPRTVRRWGNGWFVTITPFMSFQVPQVDYSHIVFGDYLGGQDPAVTVPALVQAAQVEEALEYASPDLGTANLTARMSPEQSIKIGDTHITYANNMTPVDKMNTLLYSLAAQQYLRPLTGGSYRVV